MAWASRRKSEGLIFFIEVHPNWLKLIDVSAFVMKPASFESGMDTISLSILHSTHGIDGAVGPTLAALFYALRHWL
jgi:hypothetical protein